MIKPIKHSKIKYEEEFKTKIDDKTNQTKQDQKKKLDKPNQKQDKIRQNIQTKTNVKQSMTKNTLNECEPLC